MSMPALQQPVPFPAPQPRLRAVPPLPADGPPEPPPISPRTIQRLAVCAFEVLEGIRTVRQLGAWISFEVAEEMHERRAARTARRSLYRDDRRVVPIPGPARIDRPRPDAIEATVVLRMQPRAVAVAIRLEVVRQRWQAIALTVL